jgi:hypothetical protein
MEGYAQIVKNAGIRTAALVNAVKENQPRAFSNRNAR